METKTEKPDYNNTTHHHRHRHSKKYYEVYLPKKNLLLATGLSYSAVIIFFFVFSLLFSLIIQLAGLTGGVLYTVMLAVPSSIAITLVTLLFIKSKKTNFKRTLKLNKFKPFYLLCSLCLSIGMFFGCGFINILFNKVFQVGVSEVSNQLPNMNGIVEFIIYSIVFAVLPAVIEECYFRGLLSSGLSGTGTIVSGLIIAGLFAFYHCSVTQFIYQLLYGIFLYILTKKSKSTIPAIVSHFLNNFVIILLYYLGLENSIDFLDGYIISIGLIFLAGFMLMVLYVDKRKTFNENKFGNYRWFVLATASIGLLISATYICLQLFGVI